ncbi:MAG: type III-B CRISPR module RAMP protein Cmr4 [Burkholderiales bacterium]|nr:type III-B CRISPR module RAMP protein Cmr4 [Burkholderiales bacterium]
MIHRLLTIHCLSPLHCGTGQGIAGIDLPVQRERHTGWPVIPASTIKGVLRDAARCTTKNKAQAEQHEAKQSQPQHPDADPDVIALFGPERGAFESGELGLGALSFGDGVLLAFPVRSLVGVFAWLTCPMALERLARVAELAGFAKQRFVCPAQLSAQEMLCSQSLGVDNEHKQVLIEDQSLSRRDLPQGLAEALKPLFPTSAQGLVNEHLALVHDDTFTWFARHATQVEARIALDPATKTVAQGALFYQETVPPESLFVSLISAEDARHPRAKDSKYAKAEQALLRLGELCQHPRQLGGDATIGKGLCALRLVGGQ